jgi:hypothetical protein
VADVRQPSRRSLAVWAALVVLTAQTSLQASVILPVQLISLLALPPIRRRWRRRLSASAVVLVLVGVTGYAISTHNEGQGASVLNLTAIADSLDPFIGAGARYGFVAFGAAGVAALMLLRAVWQRSGDERRFSVTLLCTWMVVPYSILLAATLTVDPTLRARYLLACAPAMCMALALLLDRALSTAQRWSGVGRIGLLGLVVALFAGAAYGSLAWHTEHTTNRWDQVTTYVFDHAAPGDRLVAASDINRLYFEYERTQRTPRPQYPQPGFPSAAWGGFGTGDETYSPPTAAQLAAAEVGAQRLWVVIYDDGVVGAAMRPRLASLSPTFRLVQSRHFTLYIDVYLYQRVSAAGPGGA